MQLLKSGKVRFIGLDGKQYSVSPGLHFSFAQCLANIEVNDNNSNNDITNDNNNNSNNNSNTNVSNKTGNVYILGDITRKLIISPDFLIGEEKRNRSTTNVNNSLSSTMDMQNSSTKV